MEDVFNQTKKGNECRSESPSNVYSDIHPYNLESIERCLIPSNIAINYGIEEKTEKNHCENHMHLEPDCVVFPVDSSGTGSMLSGHSVSDNKVLDIPLEDPENSKDVSGRKLDDVPLSNGADLCYFQRHSGMRTLIGFWLLGLCNNYGYVVMLSAAHDLLKHEYHEGETNLSLETNLTSTVAPTANPNPRDCNTWTTGAILLADIIPSLMIKVTAPFFPLCIHFRLILVVILAIAGYVLVGASTETWMAICGVISTALSSGLGEASILSYMAFYKNKNIISMWSSGTGGAGFFGSLSYAFLINIGLTPAQTLYSLCSIPALMAITFWAILEHPKLDEQSSTSPETDTNNYSVGSDEEADRSVQRFYSDDVPLETTKDTFFEKLTFIPNLFKYMIPIGLVYLFEYFINQGLLELVYFRGIWLTHAEQYRWYQVLYQIGVFISRSSLRLVQINQLWLLGLLQFLNVVFFLVQSIYGVVPYVIIIMAIVLWEGLLGGAAYVNTFHKISVEVTPKKREFSMAITSLADALGITIAAISAFPAHNYICYLPVY